MWNEKLKSRIDEHLGIHTQVTIWVQGIWQITSFYIFSHHGKASSVSPAGSGPVGGDYKEGLCPCRASALELPPGRGLTSVGAENLLFLDSPLYDWLFPAPLIYRMILLLIFC